MKLTTKIAPLFHFIPRRTTARTIIGVQPRHGTGFDPAAWLLALVLLVSLAPGLRAQDQMVPESVNYQGRLESLDTNKAYIDGLYSIEFRIWDSPGNTGASGLLWGEAYNVYVKGGYFNVVLGNGGSPLNPTPKFHGLRDVFRTASGYADRYLGITVKQDENHNSIPGVECVPRQQMLSAPFAFQSQYAQYSQFASSSTAGMGPFIAAEGLQVSGNKLSSSEMVLCNKGLTVSGAQATLQSGMTVSGPATLSSGLDVSGQTTLRGTVNLACSTTGGGFIPVGGIIMWSGATVPTDWALCDGKTTINGVPVPDLRGRFVVSTGPSYAINATGGANSVTLGPANIPSHTHKYNDGFIAESKNINHTFPPDWGYYDYATKFIGSGNTDDDNNRIYYRIAATEAEDAATQAIDIRPSYYALAYIIRVK